MSQLSNPAQTMVFCGVDVSAATLAVAVVEQDQPVQQHEFANTAVGHQALIAWLGKRGLTARVSLESTGIYSVDLALALDAAPGIQVAVLNPKAVHRFAQTLRRSKTDSADAVALAEYSRRMPFTPWCAPSRSQLQVRALSRHIDTLTAEHTRANNRLHAAQASASTPGSIVKDMKRSLVSLHKRILRLRREAIALVRADPTIHQHFQLLTSIPGVAEISALQLLAETALLSPQMSVRQWVALDKFEGVVKGEDIPTGDFSTAFGRRGLRTRDLGHLRVAHLSVASCGVCHQPSIRSKRRP
jgi:transposase